MMYMVNVVGKNLNLTRKIFVPLDASPQEYIEEYLLAEYGITSGDYVITYGKEWFNDWF